MGYRLKIEEGFIGFSVRFHGNGQGCQCERGNQAREAG